MTTTTIGSDYARLSLRIRRAGLLERRPGYYAARLALVSALYAAGWLTFFYGGFWVAGILLAVAFAQVALLAHDLAHRQVFRSARATRWSGLIAGNLGIGMSYGWWMDKHTRHHANPNHEDHDPDVAPDILVWSRRQAAEARGIARYVAARQAFLFFPLLLLEGFNLHVSSARGLRRPTLKNRGAEAALLGTHCVGYLILAFTVLSPLHAIGFILIHQCLFGLYLGSTFAPNHKGMPTLTGDENWDYLRRQVLTSRNILGGRWLDVFYGGLNYQIEHHLFPNMPSVNLRRAQPIVRQYCQDNAIPYLATGVFDSYRQALRHLHAAGAPLRTGR